MGDLSDFRRELRWACLGLREQPPIYCRGRQGLWDVPPQIAARLEASDGR